MKYKLINKQTGKEHICQKVTIDEFDYYVSDEKPTKQTKPCYCYNSIKNTWDADIVFYQGVMPMYHYEGFKIIIATNNPNIDISKVVDEVKIFSKDAYIKHSVKDDSLSLDEQIQRTGGFLVGYKEGYNKSQETHPFSEDDMIEFGNWYCDVFLDNVIGLNGEEAKAKVADLGRQGVTKDIVQLWKEQQPIKIYYESN